MESAPLQPFPGTFSEMEYKVAINRQMKRLKGALGWSLAGITLSYVLVVAAVGAIAR